ncbi:MAG: phosphoglucomutase (alpha-D-glucose-1,6-bisphosphate-dependent) [Proteobacteria bacterium]|nr:phosphoglucomutase (alpha-D-glucose-1,6-bisphosphate-dependent) [Pseudomonadota bacterium]
MAIHPQAGKKAAPSDLTNIPRLMSDYFTIQPDMSLPECQVSFGTSGHRGVSSKGSFNERHIIAISQAVAEYRKQANINGPLYIGMDSHALSEAAFISALEVLCANDVQVVVQTGFSYTPTPVVSHAILRHNRGMRDDDPARADGIIITPSHNPPMYGGFKYNPPTGGPAGTDITKWIQNRANEILRGACKDVRRVVLDISRAHENLHAEDYIEPYVADLRNIIDMDAIADSGIHLGVNPLGGSTLDFWDRIGEYYCLNLTNTQPFIDASFSFMTLDHDGKIRMDCSSPYAMASLIDMKSEFDLAFANDPDGDRHGIVTRRGLMNPNHYLAVMIEYLYTTRKQWPAGMKVGKTLVSSALIDRVCAGIGRDVYEVPVGFKWFVDGLFSGLLGFGGEESAGASFLRFDGGVWSTDKDGMIPCLLAAEMTAKTGLDPAARHEAHVQKYGLPAYGRIETAADARVRKTLGALSADRIHITELAGEKIDSILTHAPGNGAAIGGLKICSQNGWFAVRPSGTEDIYKIYAESFKGESHLAEIQAQAVEIVNEVTKA